MKEGSSEPSNPAELSGASRKAGCANTLYGHLPHCKHIAISSPGATYSTASQSAAQRTHLRDALAARRLGHPAQQPGPAEALQLTKQVCQGRRAQAAQSVLHQGRQRQSLPVRLVWGGRPSLHAEVASTQLG